jgi:hypothetical protein
MFGAFVSRIKRKSLTIFIFLSWYCFCSHLYVTICMKRDPGMPIGMHLVSFGKSGVTPPEPMQQCSTGMQQRAKICSPSPGRLDRLHLNWPPGAVRTLQETGPAPNCSKFARTNLNTFQTLPGGQSMHKLLPLVDNAWIKAKCEKFQHIASQIYKIHHKELHKSKWGS